jgi:sulfatase modifying factor 1
MRRPLSPSIAVLIAVGVAPACLPSELTYSPELQKEGGHTISRGGAPDAARGPSTGGFAMRDGRATAGTSGGGAGGFTTADSGDATLDRAAVVAEAADALAVLCPASTKGPSIVLIRGMVANYCIDSTEVTNADYRAFLIDVRSRPPTQDTWCSWNTDFEPFGGADGSVNASPDVPVTGVDWCDAYAYCSWAGKHLCGRIGGGPNNFENFERDDTSEWFNACSSHRTLEYPYGATYDARACAGADSPRGLGAVGSIATCKTPTGAFDLSGNVWEWEDSCATVTGASDTCRARGGSYETGETLLACKADSATYGPLRRSTVDASLGFRCCSANYIPP